MTADPRQHDAIASAPRRAPRGSWRSLAARLLLLVSVLVVLDVLIGVLLCRHGRFLGRWHLPPFQILFNDAQRDALEGERPDAYAGFDPDLGWTNRPRARFGHAHAFRGGRYTTNADAIRSTREYERTTPDGITRIAAFGDSFTHGNEVADEQVWTHVLEASRDGLEVLNFGVAGYGPDQAWLRYRRDGVPFDPDIVLVGLMLENVMRTVSVYRPAYNHDSGLPFVKPRFCLDAAGNLDLLPAPATSLDDLHSQIRSGVLHEFLEENDFWVRRSRLAYRGSPLFLSSIVRLAFAAHDQSGHSPRTWFTDPSSEPFRVTARVVEAFHAEALARGADRAIVLIFPDRAAVQDLVDGKAAHWQTMIDRLEASKIEVLDLTPPLAHVAGEEGGIDPLFRDVHYSPAGNQVVADALIDRLFGD